MWVWLSRLGRYLSRLTGSLLGRRDTFETVDTLLQGPLATATLLAHQVAVGQLVVSVWEEMMRQQIKQAYIAAYAFGRGGLNAMVVSDWRSVGGMLVEQYKYLRKFAAEIAAGRLSEAEILRRAKMYIMSAREAFERARRRVAKTLDAEEERWVLDPTAEHCNDCVAFSDRGWQPVGTFPLPGQGKTACLTNCRCHLEYRKGKYTL